MRKSKVRTVHVGLVLHLDILANQCFGRQVGKRLADAGKHPQEQQPLERYKVGKANGYPDKQRPTDKRQGTGFAFVQAPDQERGDRAAHAKQCHNEAIAGVV